MIRYGNSQEYNPYDALAIAIIKQAFHDTIKIDKKISKGVKSEILDVEKHINENFFASADIEMLSYNNGDLLRREIKKRVKNKWNFEKWTDYTESEKKIIEELYYGNYGDKIIATNIATGETIKYDNLTAAAEGTKVSKPSISRCCTGKIEKAKGFKFRKETL